MNPDYPVRVDLLLLPEGTVIATGQLPGVPAVGDYVTHEERDYRVVPGSTWVLDHPHVVVTVEEIDCVADFSALSGLPSLRGDAGPEKTG